MNRENGGARLPVVIWTASSLFWCLTGCAAIGEVPGPTGDAGPGTVRGQDESDGLMSQLNPTRFLESAKKSVGLGPDEGIAKESFGQAEKIFVEATSLEGEQRKDRFLEAAKLYKKAADRWPDSALQEDAMFMLGESRFFADRYPDSAEAYEALIKKYPNTRYMDTVDKRRFAMGRYWIEHQEVDPDWPVTPNLLAKDRPLFDKFGHGVRVLDKIRFDDPTGKLADDATMAAAVAKFKAGDYGRADELFADLRHSFPNSEHQFQAHVLSLKCKLKIYQGPDYSLKPMDDAEAILKQIHRQFPQEAAQEREFLANAWKEIRMNKALHDWSMAKYYDRRNEYAAAREYYERVKEQYSDTSLAGEAEERLAKIADEPDKPEPPAPWLTRMFPTPDREKPLMARNPLESMKR